MTMNLFIGIGMFIIIFGFIFLVWKLIFKKKEDNLSGSLVAFGLTLISNSFPGLTDNLYQIFFSKSHSNETNYVSLIVGIFILFFGIYLYFEFRNKIYILNIFGNDKKKIQDKNVLKQLKYSDLVVRERELDIVRIFDAGNNINEQIIKYIYEEIKEKTETFISESNDSKRGFTAMASIPLTCLSGTYFSSNEVHIYLEYNRYNNEFNKLEKRKFTTSSYPEINIKNPSESKVEFEEVVISISTTAEINKKDLAQFIGIPIIEIKMESTKDNSITTYSQLTKYALKISKEIERVKQQNGVSTIHLVMATQSCLVLEIGRHIAMNRNRIPTVIVYHYNATNKIRYPFGIIVTEKNKGMLIMP